MNKVLTASFILISAIMISLPVYSLSTPTISPSSLSTSFGQNVIFSSTWSGGTATYAASLYSSATGSCNVQSALIQQITGLSTGSVTFNNVIQRSSAYYCIYVTDNAISPSVSTSMTGGFNEPAGVAFAPSGTYAYVTNQNSNNVMIINTATNAIVGTVSGIFDGPGGVAFSPSGTFAYITDQYLNEVLIVSTATNSVTGTITGNFVLPSGVAFSPSGTFAYVVNYNDNNAMIINTATNTVTGLLTTNNDLHGAKGVIFNPSGTLAYISNYNYENLAMVNTATNAVVSVTSSSGLNGDEGMAFSPLGEYVYVTNYGSSNVAIVDAATNSVISVITAGFNAPTSVSIAPSGTYAYVTNYKSNNVIILNTNLDSANSINSQITVNSISISMPSNAIADQNQYESFNGVISGGTGPYNVFLYVSNAAKQNTIVYAANAVFSGSAWSFNSIQIPSNWVTNSPLAANVLMTDANSQGVNSTYTSNFIIYSPQSSGNLYETNTLIDAGQSSELTADPSGGASPYAINWFSQANCAGTSFRTGTSISVSPSSNAVYSYNSIDSATTANSMCSASNTITVDPALALGTLSSTAIHIDLGQNDIISSISPSGGTPPYSYRWFESNGGQYYNVTSYSSTLASYTFSTNSSMQPSIDEVVNSIYLSPNTEYRGVAVLPNGAEAFVSNFANNSVSVINLAAKAVVKVITGFSGPWGISVSPNNAELYVASASGGPIDVVNIASNTIVKSVIGVNGPAYTAFTPNGSEAYVSNYGSNSVAVIDVATNTVVNTITIPTNPGACCTFGLAFTLNGSKLYVDAESANPALIGVINTSTNEVVNTIRTIAPTGIAFTPDGSEAYVALGADSGNNLGVLNPTTNVIGTILKLPAGTGIFGVAFTPDGSEAYVTEEVPGTVSVIDVATNTLLKTLNTVSYSFAVAFAPNGSEAYVTGRNTNYISVIKHRGYAFKLQVKDGTQALYTPLDMVMVNATPSATTVGVQSAVRFVGQQTSINTILSGGTGPFTVNFIYTNNGVVANTISGVGVGNTAAFEFTPQSAATYAFNAVITDTGTTIPYVFTAASNTMTVDPDPTISISPASSSVQQFSMSYYTATVSASSGTGPFAIKLVNSSGSTESENTIPVGGGTAILPYVPMSSGLISFNAVATDSNTVPTYVFASQSNTLDVLSAVINLTSSTPAGVVHEIPIVLTNQQPTAYPANAQIMVPFNAAEYSAYEASNLQNVEFFYGNGTAIPAWLEGNALNESNPNGLSTAANDIYWLRIAPSSTFLGAYTSNTIYVGFVSTATNLFANSIAQVGEAPQLSSTYAQYDNGQGIFSAYFNGNTPSSSFSVLSGWSLYKTAGSLGSRTINVIEVNNNGNPGEVPFVYTAQPLSTGNSYIEESMANYTSSGAGLEGLLGLGSNTVPADYGTTGNGTSGVNALGESWNLNGMDYVKEGEADGIHSSSFISTSVSSSWADAALAYISGSSTFDTYLDAQSNGFYTYASGSSFANPMPDAGTMYVAPFFGHTGTASIYAQYNFVRARLYPPNGKMVVATFEPNYAIPTISISQQRSPILLGDTDKFTATLESGTGPFTVNFLLNGGVSNTVEGVASGGNATFVFQPPNTGAYSVNAVAVDTGASSPYIFNSTTITLQVNSGAGGGGVIVGAGSSTSTTSTTTVVETTTAGSTGGTTQVASNSVGNATAPNINITVQNSTAMEGAKDIVTAVTSNSNDTIEIFANGVPVASGKGFAVLNTSSLTAGTYSIKACDTTVQPEACGVLHQISILAPANVGNTTNTSTNIEPSKKKTLTPLLAISVAAIAIILAIAYYLMARNSKSH